MQNSEFGSIFGSRSKSLFQLSDATLRTDDGCTFDVHRIILARNIDYFTAMFCGMNSDRREFVIPGMSGECLSNILCYVYTGDIQITERNVRDLMLAADYLLIKDLQIKIKQCIKANVTELNCLGVLQAASLISDEDTYQECFRFIQTRFEGVVRCQNNELIYLPLEIFRSILSNRSLYVYNEITVWHAIVEWTQKDIPSRMCCVPQLLLTLAIEDMGEELATEILQHEIISKNSLNKDIIEFRSSNDFISNLDLFRSFLLSYSNPFTQPYSHRIPLNLYAISTYTEFEDEDEYGNHGNSNIYITYDENPDLWRKITEVDFYAHFLIAIGHNIYMFGEQTGCANFDLSVMDWVAMEDFSYEYEEYRVFDIDAYIYIVGQNTADQTFVVEVYDTANNRWFNCVSPINISCGDSVVVEKKIFLVGYNPDNDGMMTQMFDPVTQQWSLLSPPIINPSLFKLVAYHKKIYLILSDIESDNTNMKVFDPSTNLWKELPSVPYIYLMAEAVVFNDQLILYDSDDERKSDKKVRWNDVMECWEIFHKTYNFDDYRFCSVDDVDTIRMITKQNRNPNTQMEKSLFV